jgi:hypothetical protein
MDELSDEDTNRIALADALIGEHIWNSSKRLSLVAKFPGVFLEGHCLIRFRAYLNDDDARLMPGSRGPKKSCAAQRLFHDQIRNF